MSIVSHVLVVSVSVKIRRDRAFVGLCTISSIQDQSVRIDAGWMFSMFMLVILLVIARMCEEPEIEDDEERWMALNLCPVLRASPISHYIQVLTCPLWASCLRKVVHSLGERLLALRQSETYQKCNKIKYHWHVQSFVFCSRPKCHWSMLIAPRISRHNIQNNGTCHFWSTPQSERCHLLCCTFLTSWSPCDWRFFHWSVFVAKAHWVEFQCIRSSFWLSRTIVWYEFFVDVDRQMQAISDMFDVEERSSIGSGSHWSHPQYHQNRDSEPLKNVQNVQFAYCLLFDLSWPDPESACMKSSFIFDAGVSLLLSFGWLRIEGKWKKVS